MIRVVRRHIAQLSVVFAVMWLFWAVTRFAEVGKARRRPDSSSLGIPSRLGERLRAPASIGSSETSDLQLPTVSQPAIRVPEVCIHNRWYNMDADAACALQMAEAVRAQTGGDPLSRANLCWGYAPPLTAPYNLGTPYTQPVAGGGAWTASRGSEAPDGGGVLFHMILLTGLGAQAPMTLVSWLATQCCNARLWVWSTGPVNTSHVDAYIPEAHRHRIVYKRLDIFAEWGAVSDDFKEINSTLVDRMLLFLDIRYVSDFIRQVLLYRYGGVYFDYDTMMLQDFRPLMQFKHFFYRAGTSGHLNNAVMQMAPHHNVSRDVLRNSLLLTRPQPEPIGDLLDPLFGRPGHALPMLPAHLFDPIWLRWACPPWINWKCEANATRLTVHLEIKDFSDWFKTDYDAETYARMEKGEFYPSAFAHHWHNRYDKGIPERSWAGILFRRHLALLREKVC